MTSSRQRLCANHVALKQINLLLLHLNPSIRKTPSSEYSTLALLQPQEYGFSQSPDLHRGPPTVFTFETVFQFQSLSVNSLLLSLGLLFPVQKEISTSHSGMSWPGMRVLHGNTFWMQQLVVAVKAQFRRKRWVLLWAILDVLLQFNSDFITNTRLNYLRVRYVRQVGNGERDGWLLSSSFSGDLTSFSSIWMSDLILRAKGEMIEGASWRFLLFSMFTSKAWSACWLFTQARAAFLWGRERGCRHLCSVNHWAVIVLALPFRGSFGRCESRPGKAGWPHQVSW